MTQTEWIVSLDDDLKDIDELFVGNVRNGEQLIRCKDCKYRPKKKYEDYHEGFNLVFPDDSRCPCQCDDPWYSWMPNDDWHCGNGERKEE